LTFDDGPSGASHNNPTEKILRVLTNNSVQPDIKAIFFVQTRAERGGGTAVGQRLLQLSHRAGHLLAFHSATPHHTSHLSLPPSELALSLQNGAGDLKQLTGTAPRLVRPPYWGYSAATLSLYHRYGLQMLLTDLSANDGKIHGVNWSLRKRSNLFQQLQKIKQQIANGDLPLVDGSVPIVVTFHDINSYTARTLNVYLEILVDVAQDLHMPLAHEPFFNDVTTLEKAALARTVSDASGNPYIPGFWGWWWKH